MHDRPSLLHRVLGMWIAAALVAGLATSLAPSDEVPEQVSSDRPRIAVTVPSIPPYDSL